VGVLDHPGGQAQDLPLAQARRAGKAVGFGELVPFAADPRAARMN
jgi:hypothetical protein